MEDMAAEALDTFDCFQIKWDVIKEVIMDKQNAKETVDRIRGMVEQSVE